MTEMMERKSIIYQLIESGEHKAAEMTITDYLHTFEYDKDFYILHAYYFFKQERFNEAEDVIEVGLDKDKLNQELRYNLATIQEANNKIQEAIFNYYLSSLSNEEKEIKDLARKKLNELCQLSSCTIEDTILKYRDHVPKINVIITSYNQKTYLEQAINSVMNQTYPNFELIIADDCSTDGTNTMVKKFMNDERFIFNRNEVNLGPGYNGCHAFYTYSNAPYVLFVNHDDYLTDMNYVFKAVERLENDKTLSFVFANLVIEYTQKNMREEHIQRLDSKIDGLKYFMGYETTEYPHITSLLTSVFRREHALQYSCLTEKTKSKDLFLYLKLMLSGNVGFIEDVVGIYRVHAGSISFNMPLEYDYTTIDELENLSFIFKDKYNVDEDLRLKWTNFRIYCYFLWRLDVLLHSNKREETLNLLTVISEKYSDAAESLKRKFEGRIL